MLLLFRPRAASGAVTVVTGMFDQPTPTATSYDAPTPAGAHFDPPTPS